MSALNCIIGPAAIYMVTDGSFYDNQRKLVLFGAKVMPLPHISAAVAVLGPLGMVHLLGDLLYHEADTLDGLMASRAVANVARNLSASPVPLFVVVAGISAKHGPTAWHLVGDRFEPLGARLYISPPIDDWEPALDSPAALNASLVELVERQRAEHPVGGFVALTTISAGGVVQKILHRWPDGIGDSLEPPVTPVAAG